MSTTRFEYSVFAANTSSRNHTWPTDKSSANIRANVSVQIPSNDDIKLMRLRNQLHGCVINNHIIKFNSVRFIQLSHFPAYFQKQPIAQLHYICFVNTSDFLTVVFQSKIECKSSDSLNFSV
eukprot:NODE_275_length_10988_cov_0.409863.p9 type:complete len:122 gc:universal NODE_275_length_10988_cov_0.409863:9550-9185(-)